MPVLSTQSAVVLVEEVPKSALPIGPKFASVDGLQPLLSRPDECLRPFGGPIDVWSATRRAFAFVRAADVCRALRPTFVLVDGVLMSAVPTRRVPAPVDVPSTSGAPIRWVFGFVDGLSAPVNPPRWRFVDGGGAADVRRYRPSHTFVFLDVLLTFAVPTR